MPTLHVIDPMLRNTGGHFLTQHLALNNLCKLNGFNMVAYSHVDFDEATAPEGVSVKKVFNSLGPLALFGHQSVDIGLTNERCYLDLSTINIEEINEGDIVFLTSTYTTNLMAYGRWLRDVGEKLKAKVGIYAVVSSEVADTLARDIRRSGIPLGDESFDALDQVIIPNDQKRSMYRYLFSSIPEDRVADYRIFYEEPFPNRLFLDLSPHDSLRMIHLHSMYPRHSCFSEHQSDGCHRIAYLGSGGVGDNQKGQHLISGIVTDLAAWKPGLEFSVQVGKDAEGVTLDGVSLYRGRLDCDLYCSIIESADLLLLPYGPRYKHWMSGIFDEALFLGKVCVVPANSKMATWMEHHNLDIPVFDDWSADGVVSAVKDAVDNFGHYMKSAELAKQICRRHWDRNNPIKAFSK